MDLTGVPCKFKVIKDQTKFEPELNELNEKYVVMIEATITGDVKNHPGLVLRLYERDDMRAAELEHTRKSRKLSLDDFHRRRLENDQD